MTYIQLTSNSPQLSAYLQRVARTMPNVLDDAVYQSALMAQQMFQSTTATWAHKPTFEINHEGTGRWGIKTDDPIYNWVSEGTPRHEIKARRAPFLVFSWPSRAKTAPGVIGSTAGERGGRWARKKVVMHPGIKPREFRRIIAARAQLPTRFRLQDALERAIHETASGTSEAVGL